MLLPKFSVHQDEDFIIIEIRVPHIRVLNTEIVIDGQDFTFFCKPYLLKLAFPCEITENDLSKAVYDATKDDGTITVHVKKLVSGQYFPDLDLTTRLLQARLTKDKSDLFSFPNIDILASDEDLNPTLEDEKDNRIHRNNVPNLIHKPRYGFNLRFNSILRPLREEIVEMIELESPDDTFEFVRRTLREENECLSFDLERYLGDLLYGEQDEIFIEAMSQSTFWERHWMAWTSGKSTQQAFDDIGGFSDEEKQLLTTLPNREYNLIHKDSVEQRNLLLHVIDILFAFCYDHRVTGGESTVESAYTLSRLSSTFSWLDIFDSSRSNSEPGQSWCGAEDTVLTVLRACARRSLTYPYLRMWKLTKRILVDVTKILLLGKRCVLKALLNIHRIFSKTSTHYLLNKLFMDDYCVWVQTLEDGTIEALGKEMNDVKKNFQKRDLDLFLEDIEAADETQLEEVKNKLKSEAAKLRNISESEPLRFHSMMLVEKTISESDGRDRISDSYGHPMQDALSTVPAAEDNREGRLPSNGTAVDSAPYKAVENTGFPSQEDHPPTENLVHMQADTEAVVVPPSPIRSAELLKLETILADPSSPRDNHPNRRMTPESEEDQAELLKEFLRISVDDSGVGSKSTETDLSRPRPRANRILIQEISSS